MRAKASPLLARLQGGRRDPDSGQVFHLPSLAPVGPARMSATGRALSSADRRRIAAASASPVSPLAFPRQPTVQARVRAEGGAFPAADLALDHQLLLRLLLHLPLEYMLAGMRKRIVPSPSPCLRTSGSSSSGADRPRTRLPGAKAVGLRTCVPLRASPVFP